MLCIRICTATFVLMFDSFFLFVRLFQDGTPLTWQVCYRTLPKVLSKTAMWISNRDHWRWCEVYRARFSPHIWNIQFFCVTAVAVVCVAIKYARFDILLFLDHHHYRIKSIFRFWQLRYEIHCYYFPSTRWNGQWVKKTSRFAILCLARLAHNTRSDIQFYIVVQFRPVETPCNCLVRFLVSSVTSNFSVMMFSNDHCFQRLNIRYVHPCFIVHNQSIFSNHNACILLPFTAPDSQHRPEIVFTFRLTDMLLWFVLPMLFPRWQLLVVFHCCRQRLDCPLHRYGDRRYCPVCDLIFVIARRPLHSVFLVDIRLQYHSQIQQWIRSTVPVVRSISVECRSGRAICGQWSLWISRHAGSVATPWVLQWLPTFPCGESGIVFPHPTSFLTCNKLAAVRIPGLALGRRPPHNRLRQYTSHTVVMDQVTLTRCALQSITHSFKRPLCLIVPHEFASFFCCLGQVTDGCNNLWMILDEFTIESNETKKRAAVSNRLWRGQFLTASTFSWSTFTPSAPTTNPRNFTSRLKNSHFRFFCIQFVFRNWSNTVWTCWRCSFNVRLNMRTLSKYATTNRSRYGCSIEFISAMNVDGALVRPKGITKYSNWP